jgi:hypothetical protein
MDYAPIRAFLVGRCGKTLKEAAMTSLFEYELLADGFLKGEQEKWERVRWQVFMDWSISPNLKHRPKKPQDVVRFAWEETEQPKKVTYEPLTENEIMGLCEIFKLDRNSIRNGQN